MLRKYRFLICGYYGADNLGDDLILDSIIKSLESKYGQCEFFVTAVNPDKINHKYKNASGINHKDMVRIGSIIKNSSAIIIGGGGLFFEIPDLFGYVTPERNFYNPGGGPSLYANYAYLAEVYGTKVVFWSVGVGKIESDRGKALIRHIFNSGDLITVRDGKSVENLKDIGVNKQIIQSADPVFGLDISEKEKEDFIAISLRNWKFTEGFLKKFADAIGEIALEKNLEVKFVIFQEGAGDITDDMNISRTVSALLPRGVNSEIINNDQINTISRAKLHIGMRLHFLILSLASGSIPIAISYDDKVSSIMNDLDLGKFVLSLKKVDLEKVTQLAKEIFSGEIDTPRELEQYKIKSKIVIYNFPKILKTKEFDLSFSAVNQNADFSFYQGMISGNENKKTWRYALIVLSLLYSPKKVKILFAKIKKKLLKHD